MFEKLIIDKEEQQNYERNLLVKGEYLIGQIYDVLLDANGGEEVEWDDVVSVLKYDKALRDKLYIFLASFEEYIKADLFKRYDVASRDIIYRKTNVKQLFEAIFKKTNKEKTNLYYCFELELGPMIELFKAKNIYDIEYIEELEIVRVLRNHVMHHNVLLLGRVTNYNDALKEIKKLEKQLETLYLLMPDYGYKQAFEKALNDDIGRKYMKRLLLGEMRNGIFK